MRTALILLVSLFLLVSASPLAYAQDADILGVVDDETGAMLPGVTITARHVATGLTRTTATDAQGRYRIVSLPAGSYTITAELAGFQTVLREGITLTINMKANINFTLKVAGVAETITVTGDSPIVETTTSEVGLTFTTKTIEDLPLNGRNPSDLILLAPGVAVGVTRGGYSIAGSLERNNSYTIDGIDNNDDWVGGDRVGLQQDVVREFVLISNQFSAEYGRGVGGSVNVLTQSGTNEFRGRVNLFVRDDAIDKQPYLSKQAGIEESPFSRRTFGGSFGGPIVRDKTHFFASVEEQRETENIEFNLPNINYRAVGPYPAIQGGFHVQDRTTKNPRVFAKLTHQFTNAHSVAFTFNYDHSRNPLGGCGGIDLQCTSTGRSDWLFNGGHTWVIGPRTLNEIRVARSTYDTETDVYPDHQFTGHDRPGIDYGQQSNQPQGRDERHTFVTDTFSHIFNWRGDHELKLGAEFNRFEGNAFFASNFGGTYTFDTDRPFDPNDRSTYPIRYTVRTGDPNAPTEMNLYSAFIQDTWRILPNLTVNVGLRYDVEVLGSDFSETHQQGLFTLPELQGDTDFQTDTNNFGPRIGFAWDPWNDGKTSIRGGFGMFYDQIFLNVQLNTFLFGVVPRTQDTTIDRPCYPDPNATIPGLCGETRTPGAPTRSPNVSTGTEVAPNARNYAIGVQREITRDLSLTADVVYLRTDDWLSGRDLNRRCTLTGSLEGDCTGSIGSNLSRPDQQWLRVQQQAADGDKWYRALQVGLHKRFSQSHQFQLSYTLAKTEDTAADFGGHPQNQFHPEREKSLSLQDQRHRLVFSGSWRLPWSFQLGGILTYSNGRPFNITMGTDWNGDGFDNDRPDSVPTTANVDQGTPDTRPYNPQGPNGRGADGRLARNSGHGPNFFTIDLRVSRFFRIGGNRSLEVLGEFFNLTNRVNEQTPSGNVRSTQYYLRRLMRGEISATQTFDPFQAQIGFRFNF